MHAKVQRARATRWAHGAPSGLSQPPKPVPEERLVWVAPRSVEQQHRRATGGHSVGHVSAAVGSGTLPRRTARNGHATVG
jgi:hypothetical protein